MILGYKLAVFKENGGLVARWKWSRPDVNTYTTLVIGLAASLRVSDALKIIEEICQVGLSHGEEVRVTLISLIMFLLLILSHGCSCSVCWCTHQY